MARAPGPRLTFRSAIEGDLDRLITIHTSAFPDPRGHAERRTNFTHNCRGSLADLVVAEAAGRIVAHAFLFAERAHFGGKEAAVGAIASVGVAQEARGQGVGRALVEELHRRSDDRGDALTLLYPFRSAFYAKLGYGPVSPYRRLVVAPSSIPRAWSLAARDAGVREMRGGDKKVVMHLYEEVAKTKTGRLARSYSFWEKRFSDERRAFFVVEQAGAIVGYACLALEQAEPHAKTTLDAEEIVAKDDAVRRLLFGLVGAQRDQVAAVALELDETDPIDRAFVDPDASTFGDAIVEHPYGRIANGPMVRVHDPKRALEARGYASDGECVLDVEGESFALVVTKKRAKSRKTKAIADLSLSRSAFASLLFGAIRPSHLVTAGLAHAPGETAGLDALFTLPPFFALDPF
ncbi:MAG TPA: GNAT family N-acetyltransferase [Polyangiaceae bacterium]